MANEIVVQFQQSFVLFISSPHEIFPIWNQDQSSGPEEVLFWDYHVIFLVYENQWKILDFNTLLSFPENAKIYFNQSFRPEHVYHFIYPPHFKFIETDTYLNKFSSDRSHMQEASGDFLKPPPPWSVINQNLKPNFSDFINFNSKKLGEILNLEEVLNFISKKQK
ncbi:MAG: hypothetical protein KTR26_07495 [Flammeovirgaceae bacterium]|nr:hypothetical protein [Flammeovirgaceae bacterium]